MTIRDDQRTVDRGAQPPPGTGQPGRRRAKVVVGAVGLAAVLGVGAFAITEKFAGHPHSTTEVGALSARQGTVQRPGPTGSRAASSAQASDSPAVVASIKAARERDAKDGVKLVRPLPVRATQPAVDLARNTVGSLDSGGIVRVVSARSDLTGQQELAWVAGERITSHGADKCTQTFRLTADPTTVTRPNMLLCWRTSAHKSVIAIVIDPKGHPSTAKALQKLDGQWRSMA